MNKKEILGFLKNNNTFKENKLSSGITTLLRNKYPNIIQNMKEITEIDTDNVSKLIWHLINGNDIPKCPICGKELEFKNYGEGYKKACSKKCSDILRGSGSRGKKLSEETKEKIKKTNIKRYGVDNPFKSKEIKERIKQTNLNKYGFEYAAQSKEIKKKIVQTNFERYGTTAPLQNKEIKAKMEKTNLERYGSKSSIGNIEIREKAKKTNLKRYGVEYAAASECIKEKAAEGKMKSFYESLFKTSRLGGVTPLFSWEEYMGSKAQFYKFKCNKCGEEFEDRIINGRIPLCTHCYPRNLETSRPEKDIVKYIESIYTGKIIQNDRKAIYPRELDIYIPDKNLAIEYDGLYWHSSLFKDKNYHLNKTKACEEKGIRLIHIYSDEWHMRKPIIYSIIKSALGIYERKIGARECYIKDVDNNESKIFLEENHLQGYIPTSIRKGLYYKDELVSVLTLSKPRFNKEYDWEIIRFCSKINTQVIGGFEKLLKHSNIEGSIITYSDRAKFTGNLYRNLFKELSPSEPNYFYVKDDFHKYSRIGFQKRILTKNNPKYENLTEIEITQLLGYYRFYDCGSWKFEYKN